MKNQVTLNLNSLYSISTAMDKTFVLDCSQHDDPTKKFSACLWKNTGDPNQRFKINQLPNGYYEILESSGKVMQVKDSKINNGARIVFEPRRGQPNEWWQLFPVSNIDDSYKGMEAYFFRSFCGKTLDVKHAKAVSNAEVFQYDYNGNPNQIWIFS